MHGSWLTKIGIKVVSLWSLVVGHWSLVISGHGLSLVVIDVLLLLLFSVGNQKNPGTNNQEPMAT